MKTRYYQIPHGSVLAISEIRVRKVALGLSVIITLNKATSLADLLMYPITFAYSIN